MKKITNNYILNKSINDIPKLKEAIQKGFNIINYKEVNEKFDFFIAKPSFYEVSQKISSNYFSFHYGNFSGFFSAGIIHNFQLFPVPVLNCITHTSCKVNKYHTGKKKLINDFFIQEYNDNHLDTSLIPTNAIYILSRLHEANYFYEYSDSDTTHLNKNAVVFDKSPTRIGD